MRGVQGAGAAELGRGAIPLVHLGYAGGAKRRGRGVYEGVRLYVPGDSPRDIHWKKSVSLGRLVVKVYSSGGGGEGSRGEGVAVVIADLQAPTPEELDELSFKLLALLARSAYRDPEREALLVLTLPNGVRGALHGPAMSILAGVVHLFRRGAVFLDHRYDSMGVPLGPRDAEALDSPGAPKPLRVIASVNRVFAEEVLRTVEGSGIPPPSPYTVISGRATALRYAFVRALLDAAGYRYVEV